MRIWIIGLIGGFLVAAFILGSSDFSTLGTVRLMYVLLCQSIPEEIKIQNTFKPIKIGLTLANISPSIIIEIAAAMPSAHKKCIASSP